MARNTSNGLKEMQTKLLLNHTLTIAGIVAIGIIVFYIYDYLLTIFAPEGGWSELLIGAFVITEAFLGYFNNWHTMIVGGLVAGVVAHYLNALSEWNWE